MSQPTINRDGSINTQLTGSKVTEVIVTQGLQIRTITNSTYQPGSGTFSNAISDPKADISNYKSKTIFALNTHDQSVTIEVYSLPKTGTTALHSIKLGEIVVAAGARVRIDSTATALGLLDKPSSRMIFNVKTTAAPTTGDLLIVLEGIG